MMTGILFNIPPRLKLKAKVAGSIHEVRLENGMMVEAGPEVCSGPVRSAAER